MCRNKIFWTLLLSILLTGCDGNQSSDTQQDELMLQVLETKEDADTSTAQYTYEVERADLYTEYGADAQLLFPYETIISYDNTDASAFFQEYLVSAGSYVEAGQPLIRLTQEVDPADVLEVQLALEREQSYYERLCEDHRQDLLKLSEGTPEYAQMAFSYVCDEEDLQKELEELQERLAAFQALEQQEEVILTAPFDGYVAECVDILPGSAVQAGGGLLRLQDIGTWFYQLSDEAGTVPYGASAALQIQGTDGSEITLSGTVVQSDMILSQMQNGAAWVKFDSAVEDGQEVSMMDVRTLPQTASVKAVMIAAKNVLAVPSSFVHQEEDDYYVKKLQNGVVEKTYIIAPMGNIGGQYWVLSGLEEGDVVISN
jgi:multidrug efflux pump subunit AcrA (membrane-fusion protein)